jgi:hypothetical protein
MTTQTNSVLVKTPRWYGSPEFVLGLSPNRIVSVCPRSACRDAVSLCLDLFELRSWRRTHLWEAFLLAAYVAAIAHPLVYGSLGTSIVSMMTPVK